MSCGAAGTGPEFPLYTGDLLPDYIADARTCDGGFDWTGWTIVFKLIGPVTIVGVATGDEDGVLTHEWQAGETDVPGEYEVVFVGTSPVGRQRTFVASGLVVIITP